MFNQAGMADVLPSVIDGLRETERLVFYSALKNRNFKEIQVEQLARISYMFSPKHKYHLTRRTEAIVRMAHRSNNINLFVPIGDFGSPYVPGTPDMSFGTDLLTKLSPVARVLFHEDDDALAVKFLDGCDECRRLPRWFLPVIPMVLVNGADCRVLGTRVSYVPNYRPKDVIDNLRCLLRNEEMKPMVPWFLGFRGTIEACPNYGTKFLVTGAVELVDTEPKTVDVTELPVGMSLQDYVNLLQDGSVPNQGYVDLTDDSKQNVCLRINLLDQDCLLERKQLLQRLRLTTVISIDTMYLIDDHGLTNKYETPLEVIRLFYLYRLLFYETQQKDALDNIQRQLDNLVKEVQDSYSIGKQCISGLKFMKGKLPHEMKELFDDFIDKSIGKMAKAIASADYIDEAQDIVAEFLKQKVTPEDVVSASGSEELIVVGTEAQSKCAYPCLLVEAAGSWVRRLSSVLQVLKKLYNNKHALLQKLDELKQADVHTVWLNDLDRLEQCLTQESLFVPTGNRMDPVSQQNGEGSNFSGKKRSHHMLDHLLSER